MNLNQIDSNIEYKIVAIHSNNSMKNRLVSLGFMEGSKIKLLRKNTKDNLRLFLIRGAMIALRREEQMYIEVLG